METERQSLGFFDQLIYSVQPAKYKELEKQPGRKVISYALILSLLLAFMQVMIPVIGWFASFGGLDNLFTEVLPAIELQNGKLSVENKIEIGADSATYILIDTERVTMQESDLDVENYAAEILVAEENMIIYNAALGASEMKFADLGDISLNNEGLAGAKPFVYLVIFVTFLAQIGSMLVDLVVWGILMTICCWGPFRVRGTKKMKFTTILSFAIYAQTAMKLITAFNSCVGWISDTYILYYLGAIVSMFFLMSGLRKMEEKPNE